MAGELNHSEVQISLLFKDGLLQGSPFEEHEIRNYDFIIIPPEDNLAEKHY